MGIHQLCSAEGQQIMLQQLSQQIDSHRARLGGNGGVNSSGFWNSPRAMEELHTAQTERNYERAAVQSARQQRQDTSVQKRQEVMVKAKEVLLELSGFQAVIEDSGRW